MKLIQTFLLALVLSAPAARAAELGPDGLVRQITDDVMSAILNDKELQAGDKEKALGLDEQKIRPHIDCRVDRGFDGGAGLVVAAGSRLIVRVAGR